MMRPMVSQSSADQTADGLLVGGGGEDVDQVLEVPGELRPGPGEGDGLTPDVVGGAPKAPQAGSHLQAPDP
jgi:hypothetical protein